MEEMGYLWSFLPALFCSTLLQQQWLSHHSPKTSTLDTMLLQVRISVYRAPAEISKLLCHRMKRWTRDHTDSDKKRGSSLRKRTPENVSGQETWKNQDLRSHSTLALYVSLNSIQFSHAQNSKSFLKNTFRSVAFVNLGKILKLLLPVGFFDNFCCQLDSLTINLGASS